MTTLDVSADAGSTPAGNGDVQEGSSPSPSTDIMSGLDAGSREWITNNGIKTDDPAAMLSGLVTKSREMESLIGRSVRLPGEDATDEDYAGFYDKVTERLRPQEASGYEFDVPETMPENVPYDSEFADEFRAFAHEVKLPKSVAKQAHDWWVSKAVEKAKANQEAYLTEYTERVTSATKAIGEAWGPEGSEGYKAKQELFFKAAKGLGILDELTGTVIDDNNQVVNPKMVIALSKVGEAMFAEDSLVEGGDVFASNPFANDTVNRTKQDEIVRKDPEKAKRLIKMAGKDPQTWRL